MSASQAEIWDDSALIESWNEALEEYKKYHSIKNKGEITEDIEKSEKELSNCLEDITSTRYDVDVDDDDDANQSLCDTKPNPETENPDNPDIPQQKSIFEILPESNEKYSSIPKVPQHLIGQVQDEGIKNLLMSWYYAGYYTGLYEGQHRA